MAEQIINVRDLATREWTEQMYVFCDDMFSDLVGIFGEDNVRVISTEEYDRHCLRMRQDREVASSQAMDQTQALSEVPAQPEADSDAVSDAVLDANSEAEPSDDKPVVQPKKDGPLTPAQLRAKRLQYFERQRWTRRLRPRK